MIKEKYRLDEIKLVSLKLEGLDIVTLSFLSNLFHLEKTDFKSYHPLLTSKGFRQKTPDYELLKDF